jgi:N-carbamoyl-L-amino-acid hydrolase
MTSGARGDDASRIERIRRAVGDYLPRAARIFDELACVSADGAGVTREAFGRREQAACAVIAEAAGELDLEVDHDAAGNLYATRPGADRSAPAVVIGSHLDSVPQGGNYDGAAGVVAGLAALSALGRLGAVSPHDITVMGIRGEESPWFGTAYLGSRLALGRLPAAELDTLVRSDTGRTLAQHIAELGFDAAALRAGDARLSAANVAAYLELHIEQGPVLVGAGLPVAVATAIRGNARYPFACCLGAYAHSAAVPRAFRSDALLAAAELVTRLDAFWQELEAQCADVVFTVGKFSTDAELHAMTKVPGEVTFTLNFGSTRTADLERFRREVVGITGDIEQRRRVRFELGAAVGTDPVVLDGGIRQALTTACAACGETVHEMPTVGHDAGVFSAAGIPAGMVLVRNAHGSHNADEAMDIDDFGVGCAVLTVALTELAGC